MHETVTNVSSVRSDWKRWGASWLRSQLKVYAHFGAQLEVYHSEEIQGTYNFICESNKIIDSLSTKGLNCVFSQPNLKEERSREPWPPVYLVHTGIFRHVLAEFPSLGHGIPATLHPGLFFFFFFFESCSFCGNEERGLQKSLWFIPRTSEVLSERALCSERLNFFRYFS